MGVAGILLVLFFLQGGIAQEEEEGKCECSIWMEWEELIHPDSGPLYYLPLEGNYTFPCGHEIDCEKLCMERMNYWAEEEIDSLDDIIPEGWPYEGESWGEMLCRRSLQKYVDNGGDSSRYPGASGDPLWSWQLMEGCGSWSSVASHYQQPMCCTNMGDYMPDDPNCQ